MEKEEAITIRPVENGWIVEKEYNNREAMAPSFESMKVYRSMNELQTFLGDHFAYRGKNIESDM